MINVNGEDWRVLLVYPSHKKLLKTDGSYALGVCDDVDKAIYINQNLEETKMRRVLAHELTHAAMFSYNINFTIEQEELLADLIATYGQEIVHMTNLIFNRLLKEKRKREN